jgi:hypothetical protein
MQPTGRTGAGLRSGGKLLDALWNVNWRRPAHERLQVMRLSRRQPTLRQTVGLM